MVSFLLLSHKCQICVVHKESLSCEQILRVTFGLLVASVINALLVWSISLGCWLSLGGFAGVLSELNKFKWAL